MAENKVTLIGYYGGDKSHCLSAWQSTGIEFDYTKNINSRIDLLFDETVKTKKKTPQELLAMLAKDGHHSVFEKSTLHFQITAEVASHIHLLKHRIGVSINSECLTGDAVITFLDTNLKPKPSTRKRLDHLYEKWTGGRSHLGTSQDAKYSRSRIKKMRLRVLDEKTGQFTVGHVKDIWQKGIQYVYLVTLNNGKELKVTSNHAIYTKDGYKTIADGLSEGDLVACESPSYPLWSPVVSIELIGEEVTYDIEVEGANNNFVANGIVVHNSARYKELEDKWYLPPDWEGVQLTLPPELKGLFGCLPPGDWFSVLDDYVELGHQLYHAAVEQLTPVLGRKRAKETARYFLPYAKQLDFDAMFNFRSFMHFQGLRNTEKAQDEIEWISQQMLEQVKAIPGNPFRHSLEAFGF